MKILEKLISLVSWVYIWGFNLSAFILLPLIIYSIIYIILNEPMGELLKLPEWMFIAIILYGDTLSKTLIFYNKLDKEALEKRASPLSFWEALFGGFDIESPFLVSFAILGITISSVLLTFAIIAKYKELNLPIAFYLIENCVFFVALVFSLLCELMIRSKDERDKKKSLYPGLKPPGSVK
jgi:hypothetical protein